MCLVVTLGVIGIFAVKTLNMSVGGNITFSADGLDLEVFAGEFKTDSGEKYSNITSQTDKLQGFVMNTNTKQSEIQSKIDSWANLDLKLDSKGDAILHFSVKNNMSTTLYVYVATVLGANTNNNMDLTVSPNVAEIAPNQTTAFEILFDIIDTSINAGLTGFEVEVKFQKQSMMQTQNKIDSQTGLQIEQVDYHYIEMGTYNGEPIRWRYVADSNGTKYDGTSPVTSLKGYYVLETKMPISKPFLQSAKVNNTNNNHKTQGYENIHINDYGLSDARAYLTSVDGFIKDANISENDYIYNLISSRSVVDLYKNITDTHQDITAQDVEYSLSLSGDKNISMQKDKFWLMSCKELSTFLTGIENKKWIDGRAYWLRTPHLGQGYHYMTYFVVASGEVGYHTVINDVLIRPMFKI